MTPQLMLPNSEATARTLAAILSRRMERYLLVLIEDGHQKEAEAMLEITDAPSWSGSWNALFWGFVEAWREARKEHEREMSAWFERARDHEDFLLSRGIDPVEEAAFQFEQTIKRLRSKRA